ncbi:MAG: FAD-dependent monooxygenase [Nitrosopumilus sp.]|nr:FAD-dependent monooxygenase [Nitrosopumilus sp.]
MTKNQRLPILIIGGGIGGIVTALALSRKNISTIVLEQAAQFREAGAGIQLCPNVFKMFDFLGLTKQITNIAFFPDNLIFMDGVTGKEYSRIPLGETFVTRFKYPHGVFHRSELLSILVNECKKSPFIKLITSARVINVEEQDGTVFASTNEDVIYEGDALIACDGIWSIVRENVIGKKEPRVSKSMSYRALVPLDQIPKHIRSNDIVHWQRPNSHLVHYPISTQGFLNIVAEIESEKHHEAHDIIGNPEELENIFVGSPPEILELLKHVDKTRMWMMCDREPQSNWTKGRMTLLGDAAHPTLPHMAQGAGMAIEDAVVIAQFLEKYGEDYTAAFNAYQQERYIRTAYVQTASRAYENVHYASGIARELRNNVLSQAKPELIYDLLGLLYDGIKIPE